jgi:hypothetical protein
MTEIIQISKIAGQRTSRPLLQDVNLGALAGVADALAASGRGDLAAYVVEVLYYCGEWRLDNDNVVPFCQSHSGTAPPMQPWLNSIRQDGKSPAPYFQ